jgi:hypothetical protein
VAVVGAVTAKEDRLGIDTVTQQELAMITDRSAYTLEPSCFAVRPSVSTLPEKCPLRRILESNLGCPLGFATALGKGHHLPPTLRTRSC